METLIPHLADKLAFVTQISGNIGSAVGKRLATDGAIVRSHYGSARVDSQILVAQIEKLVTRQYAQTYRSLEMRSRCDFRKQIGKK